MASRDRDPGWLREHTIFMASQSTPRTAGTAAVRSWPWRLHRRSISCGWRAASGPPARYRHKLLWIHRVRRPFLWPGAQLASEPLLRRARWSTAGWTRNSISERVLECFRWVYGSTWVVSANSYEIVHVPPNSAAHSDARGSAVPCKSSWARAGGCERWVCRKSPPWSTTDLNAIWARIR